MKTCPVCQRPYADETMMFCLADGAQLVNVSRRLDLDATWRLTPPKTEPAPTVAAPQPNEAKPQSTIEYRPELQMAQPHAMTSVTSVPGSSRSVLPWIFGMVLVLAGSGILIAFILTRTRNSESQQLPTATQQSTPSPTPETRSSDKSAATSPANVNKPRSSSPQTTVPAVKALISSERPTSNERRKRETSKVTPDKKKVEQPKPTGESFIPASRP